MLSTSKNLDLDTGSGCSNVPKSHSSSSGVNDISGDSVSSTNSKEDLSGIKSKKDDPTFNDVLDLLKFSYILQVYYFKEYRVLRLKNYKSKRLWLRNDAYLNLCW